MRKLWNIALLCFFTLVLHAQGFAQGCSQCKAQIESSESNGLTTGNGLQIGIGILALSPYVILFVVFRKDVKRFFGEFVGMWKK